LSEIFHKFNLENFEVYAVGDCNVDLLKIASKQHIQMYADKLISSAIKCTISKSIRVTTNSSTLLDHMYTNNQKK